MTVIQKQDTIGEPTIEIDASKYPYLNKLDITVNSSNLYALLR